jgi:hypothetical protein
MLGPQSNPVNSLISHGLQRDERARAGFSAAAKSPRTPRLSGAELNRFWVAQRFQHCDKDSPYFNSFSRQGIATTRVELSPSGRGIADFPRLPSLRPSVRYSPNHSSLKQIL